jgi:CheY-like chemotaxis protein
VLPTSRRLQWRPGSPVEIGRTFHLRAGGGRWSRLAGPSRPANRQRLTAPQRDSSPGDPEPLSPGGDGRRPSRPILLVEDDDFGRETLGQILQVGGYDVLEAADADQALHFLQEAPRPGLIILDLLLPQTDGWHLIDRKQHSGLFSDIPVIVVSGADHAALPSLGVVARFEKPVAVPDLLAAVHRFLP